MYIPLLLVGPAAVLLDLASRGPLDPAAPLRPDGPRRGRGRLVGVLDARIGDRRRARARRNGRSPCSSGTCCGAADSGTGGRGRPSGPRSRPAPDLVVLSEAPPRQMDHSSCSAELGPVPSAWGSSTIPTSSHFYRLAVCSRWPVRVEEHLRLPGGSGMSVRGRGSRPTPPAAGRRRHQLAHAVPHPVPSGHRGGLSRRRGVRTSVRPGPGRLQHAQPEPRLRGARGARLSSGGTIDPRLARDLPVLAPRLRHRPRLARRGLRLGSCAFFNGPNTDHRGQLVRVLLPKEEVP